MCKYELLRSSQSNVTLVSSRRIIFVHRFQGLRLAHTDAVVVLTTIATADEAVALIRGLLERRLIACGTVQPGARSIYRWEGKIADEQEAVVMLKTRSGCIEGLRRAFAELHPYKVPELLAIPVTGGLERYLGWINSETSLTIA
jgi:periplasmic divalent cation tolerance protein